MERLDALLRILRGPEGCPWDREQTSRSLSPFLLEEAYELVDAISAEDDERLLEELGDTLLHILFQAQLAEERGAFDLNDVVEGIISKMKRRHRHILEEETIETPVASTWEMEKREEKNRSSLLDGIPSALPALLRAWRTQQRAAEIGFDWPDDMAVWDKVKEEVAEVEEEIASGDQQRMASEIGDLLFALVSFLRHHGFEAEDVLRRANERFDTRFRAMEQILSQRLRSFGAVTLEEMDAVWNEIKEGESSASVDDKTDLSSTRDNQQE